MDTYADRTSSRFALEDRKTLSDLVDQQTQAAASALRHLRRATTLEHWLAREVGPDGEDIAQEAYFRFFTNPNFGDVREPVGFLFGIARHLLYHHLRMRRREPVSMDSFRYDEAANALEDTSDQHLQEQDLVDHMIDTLRHRLPPRYLLVLVLRYVEDWSHEQIASELGIAKNSVSKYVARALSRARSELFSALD